MRTRSEWQEILGRLQKSGKTLRDFAAAEGVNWRTLENRKYAESRRGRESQHSPGRRSRKMTLVELQPAAMISDGRFEVEVGRGRRVRVPALFDADALQRLLGILESRP